MCVLALVLSTVPMMSRGALSSIGTSQQRKVAIFPICKHQLKYFCAKNIDGVNTSLDVAKKNFINVCKLIIAKEIVNNLLKFA